MRIIDESIMARENYFLVARVCGGTDHLDSVQKV